MTDFQQLRLSGQVNPGDLSQFWRIRPSDRSAMPAPERQLSLPFIDLTIPYPEEVPISAAESLDGKVDSHHLAAAILIPEDPNAPNICSKYIIKAIFQPPGEGLPSTRMALSVNSDVAVPKFKSLGASRDRLTSKSALLVKFKEWEDVTGFAEFAGQIGRGFFRIVTDREAVIYGPIEGGPKASQRFVGTGSWTMS